MHKVSFGFWAEPLEPRRDQRAHLSAPAAHFGQQQQAATTTMSKTVAITKK